jgi:hypothetical protein
MRTIERRALQSEAMGLCLGPARKPKFLKRTRETKASAEPSTKDGIEAVRLCASLFQSRLSIDTVSSFPCNHSG